MLADLADAQVLQILQHAGHTDKIVEAAAELLAVRFHIIDIAVLHTVAAQYLGGREHATLGVPASPLLRVGMLVPFAPNQDGNLKLGDHIRYGAFVTEIAELDENRVHFFFLELGDCRGRFGLVVDNAIFHHIINGNKPDHIRKNPGDNLHTFLLFLDGNIHIQHASSCGQHANRYFSLIHSPVPFCNTRPVGRFLYSR